MRERIPSVIMVRESEEQLSGSGCCGRLEGEFLVCREGPVFAERRAQIEAMGPLYRGLRTRFGDDLEIQVVDPRNLLSLIFLLVRDFLRYRVGVVEAIRTVTRLPVQAVLVNGRLVSRGPWPDPRSLSHRIDQIRSVAGGSSPNRLRELSRRS